jgi:hypothetical protein
MPLARQCKAVFLVNYFCSLERLGRLRIPRD